MASEILGLFASPELYRQQQDAALQQQAAQMAQLDPYASVRFNAIRAGQQFGGALGNFLGVQDPQLQVIGARQRVMQNIDPSDPDAILQAAQQLANIGDQQGALTLADYARKAQSELALQQQRMKEGKAAATPEKLQVAVAKAELQDRIAQMEALPQSPERDRAIGIAKNTLASLTTASKPGQVPDSIEISRELALEAGPEGSDAYNKAYRENLRKLSTEKSSERQLEFSRILQEAGYKPGTPEYIAKMREYAQSEITGKAKGSGSQVEVKLPGQGKEGAKDIPAFRDKVINTIDPFRKTVTAADQAISNISDSLKSNNFAAFRAAQTQFARAISGAGDLSQKELKAAGADPSLIGGAADYLSTLFTSTPSVDTQNKLLSTLKAIRKVAAKKAQDEIATQKKIATRSGFTPEDTSLIFNFPEFESAPAAAPAASGAKQTTRTLKSGKVVTIIED